MKPKPDDACGAIILQGDLFLRHSCFMHTLNVLIFLVSLVDYYGVERILGKWE